MSLSNLYLENNALLSAAKVSLTDFTKKSPEEAQALIEALKSPTVDVFQQTEVVVGTDPLAETDYDIAGHAVYLNTSVTIGGTKFRLQGVKLTEKRNCMTGWVKGEAGAKGHFATMNTDVMSLIEMLRTHGTDNVNEFATFESSFGQAGEAKAATVDPLQALLDARDKAKAELEAAAKVTV